MGFIHKFSVAFLMFFGAILLYFNFCLAFEINPFPGFLIPSDFNHWNSDYYFGFESIILAINDFPNGLYITEMGLNLEDFMNSFGNVANLFHDFDNFISNGDLLYFFKALFDIISAPIQALIYVLKVTVDITLTIIDILRFVALLVSGYYNIPVWTEDLPDTLVTLTTTSGGVVTW